MLRMTALIEQVRIGLLGGKDRDQHRTLSVMLAKVVAKSALSVVNWLHNDLLLSLDQTHDRIASLLRTS